MLGLSPSLMDKVRPVEISELSANITYFRPGALAGDDSIWGGGCQVAQNDFQF